MANHVAKFGRTTSKDQDDRLAIAVFEVIGVDDLTSLDFGLWHGARKRQTGQGSGEKRVQNNHCVWKMTGLPDI